MFCSALCLCVCLGVCAFVCSEIAQALLHQEITPSLKRSHFFEPASELGDDEMMEYVGFPQRSTQIARDIGRITLETWCFLFNKARLCLEHVNMLENYIDEN